MVFRCFTAPAPPEQLAAHYRGESVEEASKAGRQSLWRPCCPGAAPVSFMKGAGPTVLLGAASSRLPAAPEDN